MGKSLLIIALIVAGLIDIYELELGKGLCCIGIATLLLETY